MEKHRTTVWMTELQKGHVKEICEVSSTSESQFIRDAIQSYIASLRTKFFGRNRCYDCKQPIEVRKVGDKKLAFDPIPFVVFNENTGEEEERYRLHHRTCGD